MSLLFTCIHALSSPVHLEDGEAVTSQQSRAHAAPRPWSVNPSPQQDDPGLPRETVARMSLDDTSPARKEGLTQGRQR